MDISRALCRSDTDRAEARDPIANPDMRIFQRRIIGVEADTVAESLSQPMIEQNSPKFKYK